MKSTRIKLPRTITPKAVADDIPQDAIAALAHRRNFFQNRLHNFGLTMVVMGASFSLYYLGLFGGIPGPLMPERIGDRLAALGFSNHRLLIVFLSLAAVAISWNWLYNAVNRMLGRHMTCAHREDGQGAFCNKPIEIKKNDWGAGLYVCSAGHLCAEFRPNIIKKGAVSHFLWMMWLIFSGIVFYLS